MAQYMWRVGGPPKTVDADTFGATVERIAGDKPLETVRPKDVVNAARNRRSAIHAMFEWRDDIAGERYRRAQARNYLGSLQVVRVQFTESTHPLTRKAYYSLPSQSGYVPHHHVMGSADLFRELVDSARVELERFLTKYQGVVNRGMRSMPGMESVQAAVDAMRDEIDRMQFETVKRQRRDVHEEAATTTAPAE